MAFIGWNHTCTWKCMIDRFHDDDDFALVKISRLQRDQNQLIAASVNMLDRTAMLVERSRTAIRRQPEQPVVPLPSSVILFHRSAI
jgi:hypothetical protein